MPHPFPTRRSSDLRAITMSAAAAFGRPLSFSLPTPPLAAADDDADSWPARRRSLLAQRRELAPDAGVVVQRVALDRDAVAIAVEVVQLHELAGDQVLDEKQIGRASCRERGGQY